MKNFNITPWFERKFPTVPNLLFPIIFERLEGTTARIRAKIKDISEEVLTTKNGQDWSVQEHIGHLIDLEPLWIGRIGDISQGQEYLREADLTNQKTFRAGHNDRAVEAVIADFEKYRKQMIEDLSALRSDDLEKSSLHPRLKTPMKIIDLMNFVAEHDDHHLAFCTKLIKANS